MSTGTYFASRADGKVVLSEAGVEAVRDRMRIAPAEEFRARFGVSKSAFYKWGHGAPLSARGRSAVEKMVSHQWDDPVHALDSWSIEDLVAALKAKGVKDVRITM